jgi:hypothetical protein
MGYASTVNEIAMQFANRRVHGTSVTFNSYGPTARRLGVSTDKFKNDILAKAEKFVAKMEKERIAELQKELARLQAKMS